MERDVTRLRTFSVSGPPRRMGEAFGEEFRDDIRRLTESRIAHLIEHVAVHGQGRTVTRAAALALAAGTVDAHRAYCPSIWEEFAGIAAAAGLSVEDLLIGNGFTDFRDLALLAGGGPVGEAEPPGECSAFLVPACLSAAVGPIVGQTWDMHQDAVEFLVVLHRKPDDGPETLGLTTTGCLCLIGMNSEGVAVGNTNLVPTDARVGVNYLFTITRALQCSSAAEAAEAVIDTPRLSGHDFYMADEKHAFNVESTAARHVLTEVADDVFVHTNHYLDGELQRLEAPLRLANSRWRKQRLADNFAALDRPIGLDACWAQLADNTRGDGAICNEDYNARFGPFATVATVVQCPGSRTIHLCAGGGRTGERVERTL